MLLLTNEFDVCWAMYGDENFYIRLEECEDEWCQEY